MREAEKWHAWGTVLLMTDNMLALHADEDHTSRPTAVTVPLASSARRA